MSRLLFFVLADVAVLILACFAIYAYLEKRMNETQEYLDDMMTDFEDRWAGLLQEERRERRELQRWLKSHLRTTKVDS